MPFKDVLGYKFHVDQGASRERIEGEKTCLGNLHENGARAWSVDGTEVDMPD